MKTTGNTVLITGATSGIGKELLSTLYGLGNKIIAVSGNSENLAALAEEFPAITAITCDLSNSGAVLQLIDVCTSIYRDINIVINNAGIQYNYLWTEEKEGIDKIAKEIAINIMSPLQITYGLLPLLLAKQEAAVINVSSGLIYAPKKTAIVYCGTKSAIHNATKALRYQLERTSVKVFEIIPPLVDTAMTEGRGKGKISPAQLAAEFIRGFQNDKPEMNIGKTKILKLLQRVSPRLADKIMKDGL